MIIAVWVCASGASHVVFRAASMIISFVAGLAPVSAQAFQPP
jgi:hypothetical protein